MTNADPFYIYSNVVNLGAIDTSRLALFAEGDEFPENWKGWYKLEDKEGKMWAAAYVDLSRNEYDYAMMVLVTGYPDELSLCCIENPIETLICTKYGEMFSLPCIVTGTYEKGTNENPVYDHIPLEIADEAITTLPIVDEFDTNQIILYSIAGVTIGAIALKLMKVI